MFFHGNTHTAKIKTTKLHSVQKQSIYVLQVGCLRNLVLFLGVFKGNKQVGKTVTTQRVPGSDLAGLPVILNKLSPSYMVHR
jgi:hypothetical protein